MRCWCHGNEELRSVGIWPCIGLVFVNKLRPWLNSSTYHRKEEGLGMLDRERLVLKLLTVNRFSTSSFKTESDELINTILNVDVRTISGSEISSLAHETDGIVIVSPRFSVRAFERITL